MKKLMTALTLSTAIGALAVGGAAAQAVQGQGSTAGVGFGGIGQGYGADLGYGYGYGAGLLGGEIDQGVYSAGVNDLTGSEVMGANGEEIGEVQNLIRNCNVYVSVNVDAELAGGQAREILVPLNQLILTEDGFIVGGLSRDTIDRFPTNRPDIGLKQVNLETTTETGAGGGTIGGLYGAQQGWSACRSFGYGTGSGMGVAAGLGRADEGIAEVGSGLGEGAAEVGQGLGQGVAEVGQDIDVGQGVGQGAAAGAGAATGMGAGGGTGSNMLGITTDALEGAQVIGEDETAIGQIGSLYRSSNLYAVVEIDEGWFGGGSGQTAVVPIQRFQRTEEGLFLPGVTTQNIGYFQPRGGVYGGFWNAGYSTLDAGYYNTIGEVYED